MRWGRLRRLIWAFLVVVAAPRGRMTEILTDGEDGLLFAPSNAEVLVQKILR